jgi:hypothetical protein
VLTLSAQVAHVSRVGQGDRSRSMASLASVNATVLNIPVQANFLQAEAVAVCTNNGPTASGSSDLAELFVNNQQILDVDGSPLPGITFPYSVTLGTVTVTINVNEQTRDNGSDASFRKIKVTALHITAKDTLTGASADVMLANATADIRCQGPPECSGAPNFVTGGGWVPSVVSGDKANFAVAGKNGSDWGHLTFIDHGKSLKFKATSLNPTQTVVGTKNATIVGAGLVSGDPNAHAFVVNVTDNGEPGRNSDLFVLTIFNTTDQSKGTLFQSYVPAGAAAAPLGGGNIQIHIKCKQ